MKKIIIFLSIMIGLSSMLMAKNKVVIDEEIKQGLELFKKQIFGADIFLSKKAKGILIFPNIVKAGFGIGGEYGEGALIENEKITQYYSIASASVGFQLGVQKKTVILIFLTEKALNDFKNSDGWKIGGSASVTLLNIGVGEDLSTMDINKPIIAFVIGTKGLMYNLTIEGSKISKIIR